MRDQAAGTAAADNDRYLAGFSTRTFFFPGPSGYDAALAIRTADIAELSDITFPVPISVQISGSALLYELDEASTVEGAPVPELEAAFPGIRRMILEHNLRYTFVRFGVPYVVSVTCFDAGRARFKMPTCRDADRVARRFLGALRIVGGTPQVFNDNAAAVAALKNGQIDGVVVDLPTAFYLSGVEVENGIIAGQFPLSGSGDNFGLLLAKDSPLTACVSQAVDALRADGTLDTIAATWLGSDAGAAVLK